MLKLLNKVISFTALVVLDGEKYLARNALAKSFQLEKEPGGWDFSYILALSFRVNGNNLSLNASLDTPLYLSVS